MMAYYVNYGTKRDIERNAIGTIGPIDSKDEAIEKAKKMTNSHEFASVVEDPHAEKRGFGGRFIKSFWGKKLKEVT